jgi:hypothetical protein
MAVKFTDLNELTVPDDADLFILRDSDLNTTKYVTWENIQLNILSEDAISARGDNLVSVLNQLDSGQNTPNNLNSTRLWYNLAYRQGDYFLRWANQLDKPALFDTLDTADTFNLSEFDNNTGFIRWIDNGGDPKLIYENTTTGTTPRTITTDDLTEGNQNLYYTEARVDARFTERFPDELSRYTATFDQGNTADSLSGIAGEFLQNVDDTVQQEQANTIRIATAYANNFNVGQKIRIYGASESDTDLIEASETNFAFAATPQGLNTTGSTTVTFSYRASEFSTLTGEIAASYGPITATIEVPEGYSSDPDADNFVGQYFSPDKFIQLTFNGSTGTDRGVAVYRKDPGRSQHKLVAVLGPKDIADVDGWNDYYSLDYVSWSNKDESTNEYTSVVHFPLIAPTVPLRGWVDSFIRTKTVTSTHIDLVVGDTSTYFWTNSGRACQIAHNDTEIIQDAITANANVGRKSVDLNAKTYMIGRIDIPNNFGLNGTPYLTKLQKLPWSGGEYNSAAMIRSSSTSGPTNISIVGVDLEGDASNQILFADSTDPNNNYTVNYYRGAVAPLFDKVRITNVVGGGVWATDSSNFRFTNGSIENSGSTDRWDFSPLVADAGLNTIITSNVFKNFTNYIDVSVTDRAVVTNNIIENAGGSVTDGGGGLFIYGSKFILSSPNILIGPADEFIPQPDILNSEYDSINIYLSGDYITSGGDFESPVYVYQENGEVYDLTYTEGQNSNGLGGISEIYYDVFLVAKDSDSGEEYFWTFTEAGVTAPTLQPIPQVRSEGKFMFRISAADIARIKTSSGNLSVTSLKGTGSGQNPDHVGLAYSVSYENELHAATVPSSSVADLTLSGVRDPTSTSGTGLNLIYDTGVQQGSGGGEVSGDDYAIKVYNMKYLSVGSRVKMNQHTNFSANGNTTDGVGTITYVSNTFIDGDDTFNYVLINFPGTTSFDIGDGGYINIIDKFVMAQGRIL